MSAFCTTNKVGEYENFLRSKMITAPERGITVDTAAIRHFCRAGFACMGMVTIVTDVVRENGQTYRLGWSEQCKDGSKMGWGMPEYLLGFRKPPTDTSRGYADTPVLKDKADYSRHRWQ